MKSAKRITTEYTYRPEDNRQQLKASRKQKQTTPSRRNIALLQYILISSPYGYGNETKSYKNDFSFRGGHLYLVLSDMLNNRNSRNFLYKVSDNHLDHFPDSDYTGNVYLYDTIQYSSSFEALLDFQFLKCGCLLPVFLNPLCSNFSDRKNLRSDSY